MDGQALRQRTIPFARIPIAGPRAVCFRRVRAQELVALRRPRRGMCAIRSVSARASCNSRCVARKRWPGSMTPKNALKALLLQSRPPREAVFRPKTGFVSPPLRPVAAAGAFLRRFEAAIDANLALAFMIDRKVGRQLLCDLHEGPAPPPTTYNFRVVACDHRLRGCAAWTARRCACSARRSSAVRKDWHGDDAVAIKELMSSRANRNSTVCSGWGMSRWTTAPMR
jgi:hypothetical protein